MFADRFLKLPRMPWSSHSFNDCRYSFRVCLGLHIVVMIAGTLILQEIFAIDMLTALKPP